MIAGLLHPALAWLMAFLMVFLAPLILTLLLEMPVIVISGRGSAAAWKAGVLVNTLTNPVVVLLVLLFGPVFLHRSQTAYGVFLGAIEVAVVVVEWRLFTWVLGWSNRHALVTSAIANGLSFGVGLLLANGLHWV